MKNNNILPGLVFLCFSALLVVGCNSPTSLAISESIVNSIKSKVYPSSQPDHIILNLTPTPSSSVAVNWRTTVSVNKGIVEYTVAAHGPFFAESTTSIPASTETYTATGHHANFHSAVIKNLNAGEKYLYRVGDGTAWSEWFQFKTASNEEEPFSFIYFGDAQNDVKSMWSRVIREAYSNMPKASFLLHAGDLINVYNSDNEWNEWFEAGSFIHSMVPSVMVPGNHEYGKGNLSPQWKAQFNLPLNGPEGLEETCYYIDYKDLRVISINSQVGIKDKNALKVQAEWLENVLTENTQKWTAITLHHPLFSTKPNRDHTQLRELFKPLIDQYKVDIVLQGHDHAYGRGHNVPGGANANDNNTMYVVSVSGPKMYDISDDPWMTKKAKGIQLFQILTIDGEVLKYEAYTARGDLFDAFDLVKGKDGNQIIDKIPE